MTNAETHESVKKRVLVDIAARRNETAYGYRESWKRMIKEWSAPRKDNAMWLMYHANYLFNTGGIKWAMDPVLLNNRVPEAPAMDVTIDLKDLSFILLSHSHEDHCDVALWKQLTKSNCHWIIPPHLVDFFTRNTAIDPSRYTVAVSGRKISISGIAITPFDSPHMEKHPDGRITGVPSTGYFVETGTSSFLFPVDIRTYDPACLSPFKNVSVVVAHVFLGRSAALLPDPPLFDAFIRFYLACNPKKIILSHLYEFGRNPEDCWIASHATTIAKAFTSADKKIKTVIPDWYKETIL